MCARCDELEEEVAYLKSELGLVADADQYAKLKREFLLSPSEASIVLRLHALRGRPLTRAQLLESTPGHRDADERGDNLISVYVTKIRAKLGKDSIQTVWGRGFAISPAALDAVSAALGSERAAA